MRNVWVLFVGQVRDEPGFINKIEIFKKLKSEGVISGMIYSTWVGEIDKYDGLRNILENCFDKVIETIEPKLRMPGHLMHQMQTIHFGLMACPPDAHILKLRPDLGEVIPFVPAMKGEIDTKVDKDSPLPLIFQEKMIVVTAFCFMPFYINDIIYFGLLKDIEKIIHFNIISEVLYVSMAPEQAYFCNAYREQFPIASTYMRTQHGLVFNNPDTSARINRIMVESDFWMSMFALYVFLLDRDFRFFTAKEVAPELLKGVPYGSFFNAAAACPGTSLLANAQSPVFSGELCVRGLIEGWFENDAFGERFHHAFEKVRRAEFHAAWNDSALTEDAGVREFEAQLGDNFPHHRSKLLKPVPESGGVTWRLDYSFSNLHIPHDEQMVVKLEEELHRLRRTNDDLNRQITALKLTKH